MYQSNSDHTKYYNTKGEEVPSVTTILKIMNKPALVHWANGLGFKRETTKHALEKSSYIGTNVHAIIDCILNKRKFIYPTEMKTWFYEIPHYIRGFSDWLNDGNELIPIFTETPMNTEKFGGTCDFYGMYNGKKTLIDFKTSKAVYSSMFLQLGGYVYMLEEKGEVVEQVGILTVNKGKSYITLMSREDLQKYIDAFLKIVDIFHTMYSINEIDGWKQEF